MNKDRQIRISTGGKVWQADASGSLSIQVPLKPGLNVLDIVCQDPGTNSADSNGETIALPLGLWDYRIADREEVSN